MAAGGKGRGEGSKRKKGAECNRPDEKKHNGAHCTVVSVGDVGYTFRKEFDDGWYTGKVVKIRSGAGESAVAALYIWFDVAIPTDSPLIPLAFPEYQKGGMIGGVATKTVIPRT